MKKVLLFLLSVIFVFQLSVFAFAAQPCSPEAYVTIVTASDFQARDLNSYNSIYPGILKNMKNNYNVPTPDYVLIGGDYSRQSGDIASAGIIKIKDTTADIYHGVNKDAIYCIQGNHDLSSSAYTKTGLLDLGTYLLYTINENDFPEKEDIAGNLAVKSTAKNLKSALDKLVSNGEKRPVIIMTHVPLHHSSRRDGADNKYSSLLFDVINNAAKTLDIVFLFGHNHSGSYDNYLGGSVNFLTAGDTIRIPNPDKPSNYNNKTLNFTYTNFGYVNKTSNSNSGSSTDVPTAGLIQITPTTIILSKFTESSVHSTHTVSRKNTTNGNSSQNNAPTNLVSSFFWKILYRIKDVILKLFLR